MDIGRERGCFGARIIPGDLESLKDVGIVNQNTLQRID